MSAEFSLSVNYMQLYNTKMTGMYINVSISFSTMKLSTFCEFYVLKVLVLKKCCTLHNEMATSFINSVANSQHEDSLIYLQVPLISLCMLVLQVLTLIAFMNHYNP